MSGWPRQPLKHLAHVSVSNVDKKSADDEVSVRLVNYTDVYYGDRLTPELDLMRATASSRQVDAFRLQAGDVVITKDSETADDIGIAAFVERSAPDVVCGYHLSILRPRPGQVDGRFLYWSMKGDDALGQLSTGATGVTRYGLRTDVIASTQICMPPLEAQRAIADYLDTETARIDALITKKRHMITLLEERLARAIDDCFGPDGVVRLVRLGWLARIQTGVTVSASRESSETDVTMPYLRVANVQPGRLELEEITEITVPLASAQRSWLQHGDVLMTEGGDIDKLGRGTLWRSEIDPCLHQNHVFAVRTDPGRLLPEYLARITQTSWAREYFESTGVQSTNLASTNATKVADFRVPLPGVEGQAMRLSHFDSLASSLEDARAALQQQLTLLAEHRQALITAAVTGALRVSGAGAAA